MGQAATVLRCSVCQREAPAGAASCPEHGATLVDEDPLVGRVISRRYRLVRCVGRGGMGAVYEGRHIHTDQRVAVKVLAPHLSRDLKLVARFRREAMATSRLRHENCVQVHDFGEDDDGTFFIAMELVDGRGIGDEIRRTGPVPAARVARVGVQLLGALEAAHSASILHRDLKPQNIMLTQKVGRPDFVKVVDFGIAKFVENSPEDQVALTLPGTIFGTPEYMSPEQARGETLDGKSDLYSAAVVLWHMLLGRSPYRGKTIRETLLKVFRENPPRPSEERPAGGVPRALEDALLVALAKEPRDRYPDAATFARALLPFVEEPTKVAVTGVLPGTSEQGGAPPATIGIDAPEPAGALQRTGTLIAHGAAVATAIPPGPTIVPDGAPSATVPDATEPDAPEPAAPEPAAPEPAAPEPAAPEPAAPEPQAALEAAPAPKAHQQRPEPPSPDAPTAPLETRHVRPSSWSLWTLILLVVGGGAIGGLGLGAAAYGIVRTFTQRGAAAESASGQGAHAPGPLEAPDAPRPAPDEDGWVPLEGFPGAATGRSPTEALQAAADALAGEDLDAAGAAYEEALRGDPKSAAALQGLALVAYRRGDLARTKRHLEELMQLGDEHERQFRGFYGIVSRKLERQPPP